MFSLNQKNHKKEPQEKNKPQELSFSTIFSLNWKTLFCGPFLTFSDIFLKIWISPKFQNSAIHFEPLGTFFT